MKDVSIRAYEQALDAYRDNRLEAAMAHLHDALSTGSKNPNLYHLAGVISLSQGLLKEAGSRFREAIGLSSGGAGEAASWAGLGRVQLSEGQLEHALACFERAARIAPSFAPAHSGQAAVWCDLGDYRRAELESRKALAQSDDARTSLILARALIFQSRIDEAEPLLEALAAIPEVRFLARFHLAGCAVARGHGEEAANSFRLLLRQQPTYPGYLELARAKTFRGEDDPDLARMRALLQRLPDMPPRLARVLEEDISFALAKAYDDLDASDTTFSFLVVANRLRSAEEPFDAVGQQRRVETVLRLERALSVLPGRGNKANVPAPLVIAALPRSGSTLLEQMLCGHPAIAGGGEFSPFIPVLDDLLDRFDRSRNAGEGGDNADAAAAAEAERSITALLSRMTPGIRYVTEKSPVAYLYAGLLGAVQPGTCVIHLRRHPLDAALSQFMQRFTRGLSWTYDMASIAQYHASYEQVMGVWRERLGTRFLDVTYEALVDNPRRELERILAFCGLDYHPECEQFHLRSRSVWTASGLQVRKPLTGSRIGRWRRYAGHLEPLQAQLASSIERYEECLLLEGIPF